MKPRAGSTPLPPGGLDVAEAYGLPFMAETGRVQAGANALGGDWFANDAERQMDERLALLRAAGHISGYRYVARGPHKHSWELRGVNGSMVGNYSADFEAVLPDGLLVCVEVKGERHRREAFNLRARLFRDGYCGNHVEQRIRLDIVPVLGGVKIGGRWYYDSIATYDPATYPQAPLAQAKRKREVAAMKRRLTRLGHL